MLKPLEVGQQKIKHEKIYKTYKEGMHSLEN